MQLISNLIAVPRIVANCGAAYRGLGGVTCNLGELKTGRELKTRCDIKKQDEGL